MCWAWHQRQGAHGCRFGLVANQQCARQLPQSPPLGHQFTNPMPRRQAFPAGAGANARHQAGSQCGQPAWAAWGRPASVGSMRQAQCEQHGPASVGSMGQASQRGQHEAGPVWAAWASHCGQRPTNAANMGKQCSQYEQPLRAAGTARTAQAALSRHVETTLKRE